MRIISFSLWGDNDLYNIGAVANAELALEVYPEWICRFYTLKGNPAISRLKEFRNVELVEMQDEPGFWKMFWRLAVAAEPEVEFVIFRDCDSRLGWRERGAVDRWICSGKSAHVMRDIETHSGLLMLGGMWGVRGGLFPDIETLKSRWAKSHPYPSKEDDQLFLKDMVWPRIESDVLCHGVPYIHGGPKPEPFPEHRPWRGEYVGMVLHPDYHENSLYLDASRDIFHGTIDLVPDYQGRRKWRILESLSSFFRRMFHLMTPWRRR